MSDFGSFSDLASVKGNTVEKPKPLPAGHYSALITGPFKEHKAKTGNFAMRFPLKLVEAMSDVDQEALLDDGAQKAMQRDYSIDFWMSPDARWRFTEFAKGMGISDDLNLIEMAEELAGMNEPFVVEVSISTDQNDPEKQFTRIDSPAPLSSFKN